MQVEFRAIPAQSRVWSCYAKVAPASCRQSPARPALGGGRDARRTAAGTAALQIIRGLHSGPAFPMLASKERTRTWGTSLPSEVGRMSCNENFGYSGAVAGLELLRESSAGILPAVAGLELLRFAGGREGTTIPVTRKGSKRRENVFADLSRRNGGGWKTIFEL